MSAKKAALKAAFPHTIPILTAFLFLGMSYGFLMSSKGFPIIYPICMSIFVFAGSMQFVAMNLLLSSFNPAYAFLLTLMVNARHIFYGISMLDKFKDTGRKKLYLIFGMCDESFSINCSAKIPDGVDKGWFMFFVTLLNQVYWVTGTTLGALLGNFIKINTKGLDFVLTALFVVIFLNQWMENKNHVPALVGVLSSALCLLVFGSGNFIIPSMMLILISFIVLKKREERFIALKKREESIQ